MPRILILAGEASGDLHGANLARALSEHCPGIELEGLGGNQMRAAGVRLLSGIEKLDIIGIPSFSELRRAIAVFKKLSRHIASTPYDAVVLVDNPGLNLRLARVAKRSRRRVVYYIAPQIWAWNRRRIKRLRKYVDRLLVILPFEENYFGKAGIDVRFVGHPIMDNLAPDYSRAGLREAFGVPAAGPLIGLLPGSRRSEIQRLLPVMLEAAQRLEAKGNRWGGAAQFILAHAPSLPLTLIESMTLSSGLPIKIVTGRSYDVIGSCDVVMVASGTATLQTALVGRPMTIIYRASALAAFVFSRLIRVPWIGLANLVAGRLIARELIQDNLTAERLADETALLLDDPKSLMTAQTVSEELRGKLGAPGASHRAAAQVLDLLGYPVRA